MSVMNSQYENYENYELPNDSDSCDALYECDDYGNAYDKYANIPQELRDRPNWVGYRTEQRENGKLSKVPINPRTGEYASPTNPETWGTYREAVDAQRRYNLAGIGFNFGAEFQGYVGVDIDNAVLDDRTLKPFAKESVSTLNSYMEYSPRGNGIHIICKSSENMQNWGYGDIIRHHNDELGIEIYDSKYFFTVTGEILRRTTHE